MDYQYYRGEPLIRLPKWMQKFIPWMRHIGISMVVLSLVFPFLIIIHVAESTLFLNCISILFNFYGVVIWVYGHSLRKVAKLKDEQLSQSILDYYDQKRKKNNDVQPF